MFLLALVLATPEILQDHLSVLVGREDWIEHPLDPAPVGHES